MHGLTGGSWKRHTDRTRATEMKDTRGNLAVTSGSETYRRCALPRQLSTLLPRRNRHKRPILAAPHQVNNLTMPPHASLHFLRRRPSPNELTSTHHKGPFGGTPWHRRGDSCRYGSGSRPGLPSAILERALATPCWVMPSRRAIWACVRPRRLSVTISSSRSMVLRPSDAQQARPAARCGTLRLR